MANPLKILTVLTASEAAQFKKAVQVETGGLTVSAGDTVVQNITASNLSASGNAQFGGNVTVAGDITLRDANLRDARLSGNAYLANAYLTGAFLSGDAYLANAYLTGATLQTASVGVVYAPVAYFSGSSLNVDGVAFNTITSSIKTLITNEASARVAGDIAVAATASSNLSLTASAIRSEFAAADVLVAATASYNLGVSSSAIRSEFAAADALVAATASYNLGQATSSVRVDFAAADAQVAATASYNLGQATASLMAEDLTFLKLDGTRAMTAALNMGGFDITSAKSGSFSGDVSVAGNLQVNGALTYVNSTELQVTDKLITIAKGAVNAAAANGGGIELEGASASLTYASSGDKWVANKSFEVASDLFISGAQDFSYINVARTSGKYDVDAAIQALDQAVSGAVSAGGSDVADIKASYDALRQVVTGALTSGAALLTLSGSQFAAAEIDNLALDVMVKNEDGKYCNDLVAITMYADGSAVKVSIDAPASPTAAYRLIVVNEKDGGLNVI
jgi:hypothetical protein